MYYLNCDYNEGCHPAILEAMAKFNYEQTGNYGLDRHSSRARELIGEKIFKCGEPPCAHSAKDFSVDIHFLVGGTQTNLTVIAAALRPCQAVIAASTGHINVHEGGAIEATGHKVIGLDTPDGRLTARQVDDYIAAYFADETLEHMAQPKLVYISQPTELGTLYSREELYALREVCDRRGLYLYMDGARLGYGLAADKTLTLRDCAVCCDAFYIGGTKVGAMFGEAVVIRRDELKPDFRTIMKQHGAMFAKGAMLGLQFETLFTGGLYYEISERAIELAMKVKSACRDAGYPMLVDSPTNQQFPILPDSLYEKLCREFKFSFWCKPDASHTALRVCTSWATDETQIDKLCALLANG